MDRRGMPPRVDTVREMARLLLVEHTPLAKVGKNWVQKFITRHNTLKTKFNRKYDYQRA